MSVTDSISIFSEGTFEEQVQELVGFLNRSRPESERQAQLQPFHDALKTGEGQKSFADDPSRRRQVLTKVVDVLGDFDDSAEKEFEGFFNLLIALLINSFPEDSLELSEPISHILKVVVESLPRDQTHSKYRILSNLFNSLPRRSALRLAVCKALLQFSAGNDELDVVQFTPVDVGRWLKEWDATSTEKSDFLKLLADTFAEKGRADLSYSFLVSYVRSLPPMSPSAPIAALRLVATALRSPSIFDFDALFGLEQLKSQNSHPLYSLLQVFANKGLEEFEAWRKVNTQTLLEFDLDEKELDRKLRLLVLTSLAFANIGQSITYAEISSTLGVEKSDVEKWVIDVIRAGLLSGKLSQTTQILHVTRASSRGFGHNEWAKLEQRLLAWKTGLAGIRSVLSTARQNVGGPSSVFERNVVSQKQVA